MPNILFDNKLTWISQIKHICSKLIKSVAILAKLRYFIPSTTLRNVYNSLIKPHLDYGAISWGAAAPTNLHKIETLQNKAVRIMSFKDKRYNATPLYKHDKILPLRLNTMLNQSKILWKCCQVEFWRSKQANMDPERKANYVTLCNRKTYNS